MTDSIAALNAALSDRYRIERELGAGGMATVYLAEDLKHHRQVAIKVLRPELAASLGPDRFMQEIEIAARLQHPHILPVHDSGEAGGFLFYVMPYVEGESLRDRLSRHGELPVHDAVRLLAEITEALAYAHRQGVVHRDIKPENIMVSGRHALVMDFGVAKAVSEASGRNRLTTAGVALGTPTYMAPEQASADPNLDQRVDIYALGVLGYELLAGRPPFTGATAQQILAAHVTQAPEPVTTHRPTTSPALAAVIMRALQKRPADRWQTADDMLAQLEPLLTPSGGMTPTQTQPIASVIAPVPARRMPRWSIAAVAAMVLIALVAWWRIHAAGNGTGSIRAIAVLPFDNVGHDTADDYLADGMANDIRESLMKLPDLTVKARTSSEAERGKSIQEAGTSLHVGALLQGEFHQTANHVTVTVDLVKADDETALWSHDYVLPADGNFSSAQDSITVAVAKALHLTTSPAGSGGAGTRGTADQQAYDLYLRGQFFFAKRGAANLNKATDYFREAIARDSKFARAYAGLALAEDILSAYEQTQGDSIVADGEAMARRALALDPQLADAHVALAQALTNQLRPADAEPEYQAAIALDPRSATARQWHGDNLNLLARSDDAIAENQAATTLDPLSAIAFNDLAYTYVCSGRYADAITAGRRAIELDPSFANPRQYIGTAQAVLGHPDSAALEFQQVFDADSSFPGLRPFVVWQFVLQSRWPDAEREASLIPTTESSGSRDFSIGAAQVALGNHTAAMDALERAVRSHSFYVSETSLGCDPIFAPLRGEPRFAVLVKQAGQGMCSGTVKWPIPPRPGVHAQ